VIIKCATCGQVLGEKEPLEDKSETHTFCERDFRQYLIDNGLDPDEEDS